MSFNIKPIRQICFLAAVCWALFLLIGCNNSSNSSQYAYYNTPPFDVCQIQNGDIIMRRGSGMLSNYIIKLLGDSFNVSHCGVVLMHGDSASVVHSIMKEDDAISGIIEEPLHNFMRESLMGSVIIVRLKNQNHQQFLATKSKDYSLMNIAFDRTFDIFYEEKMYCTEMIWRISNEYLQEDIFTQRIKIGNHELLKFDNFFNPIYFEVVYSDF